MTQRDRGAGSKRVVLAQGRLDDNESCRMKRKKVAGKDPKQAPRQMS
jgi:hypothetical protein